MVTSGDAHMTNSDLSDVNARLYADSAPSRPVTREFGTTRHGHVSSSMHATMLAVRSTIDVDVSSISTADEVSLQGTANMITKY